MNTTPYPLRSRAGGGGSAPPNYNARERRDQWDGISRPSFTQATVLLILNRTPNQAGTYGTEYQCSECGDYFHRKGALLPLQQKNLGFITIDHDTPFRVHIWDSATPDDDGIITKGAAQAAYNDPNNLIALCSRCNPSKGGHDI